MTAPSCNGCRFWHEDQKTREPTELDWSFGTCRRSQPTISEQYVKAFMPQLAYGKQTDPEIGTVRLTTASLWPATHSADWCGEFASVPGKRLPPGQAFARLQRQWRAAADAERTVAAAEDAGLDAAADVTDAALSAFLAMPTGSMEQAAAKLTAIAAHYDLGACGCDRALLARLVADLQRFASPDLAIAEAA